MYIYIMTQCQYGNAGLGIYRAGFPYALLHVNVVCALWYDAGSECRGEVTCASWVYFPSTSTV